MSEFIRTRFLFILVMLSLSIAQGLVVHASQVASNKLGKIIPSPVSIDMLKHYP